MKLLSAMIPAGRGRPAPRPSAYDITPPCEKPPSTARSCGMSCRASRSSSQPPACSYVDSERVAVREADPPHDVPVRPARRQRQRPPRGGAEQAPLGVEHVEQREEVVLVGAAAVEEDERALGIPVRGPDAFG